MPLDTVTLDTAWFSARSDYCMEESSFGDMPGSPTAACALYRDAVEHQLGFLVFAYSKAVAAVSNINFLDVTAVCLHRSECDLAVLCP